MQHTTNRKLLSILLTLFVFAQTAWAQNSDTGSWQDHAAASYAGGSGTKADPYMIETAEQLAKLAKDVNTGNTNQAFKGKYFKLAKDIDLKGYIWMPIGHYYNYGYKNGISDSRNRLFCGTFDGNGYAIKNMHVQWEGTEQWVAWGLFSTLIGASSTELTTVTNFILDSPLVEKKPDFDPTTGQGYNIGVVVGEVYPNVELSNIIIRNAEVTDNDETYTIDKETHVGGIAGNITQNGVHRNFNISADTKVSMLKNATVETNDFYIASGFGLLYHQALGSNSIYGTNFYHHGEKLSADNSNTTIKRGSIAAMYLNNGNQVGNNADTWYYDNKADYTNANNKYGRQVRFEDFAETFVNQNNKYIEDQQLNTEKNTWVLRNGMFAFKHFMDIKVAENEYKHNQLTTSYTATVDNLSDGEKIAWTIDGNTVSADDTEGKTITVDITNKTREGKVSIVDANNDVVFEKTFSILPKTYSVDLYADEYDGGTGSKENPYLIGNDMQLAKLAHDVNTKAATTGKYYKLTADIDLSKALWQPIGSWHYEDYYFNGKFDGDGHTISNMRMCWEIYPGANAWSSWGLFAVLEGKSTAEEDFCSITNFIIDNAVVEKLSEHKPNNTGNNCGINIGVVVGEISQNSEISNIIVKNTIVTDNDETYSCPYITVGGIIGNVPKTRVYRIFNLSAGVNMQMFKNTNLTGTTYMAEAFGCYGEPTSSSTAILPTNIYVHGTIADTQSKVNRGGVVGSGNSMTTTLAQTWYYTEEVNGSGTVLNLGMKAALSEFATTFANNNNKYIDENGIDNKCTWTYKAATGFQFGTTILSWPSDAATAIITAETVKGNAANETYYWYTSSDKKTWTLANKNDAKNPFTLPYTDYNQYVYAVLNDGSSRSRTYTIAALRATATLVKTDVGNNSTLGTIEITNTIWGKNCENLKITYTWVKNDDTANPVGTENSYTKSNSDSDRLSCHVVVKSYDESLTMIDQWIFFTKAVVYLDPENKRGINKTEEDRTNDSSWGYSASQPMLTWKGAYTKLSKNATWDENVIVLMGTSTQNVTNNFETGFNITKNVQVGDSTLTSTAWNAAKGSPLFCNTTITGSWDNTTYDAVIELGGAATSLPIWGDTKFDNLTFRHETGNYGNYDIIYCQYNNLEIGKNVVMANYENIRKQEPYETIDGARTTPLQIFGGFNNDSRYRDNNQQPTDITTMAEEMPHGREGFSITLKSGFYSAICVGGHQSSWRTFNGIMGSPNMPIKCKITLDINREFNDSINKTSSKPSDYDAGIILAGNHEGAMFADVDIVINSGKVGRIVNGTLGNHRNASFSYNGKSYGFPYDTYMGRANILLDPKNSKNNLDANINNRVIVTELYGGSTGRGFSNNTLIDNPFYGKSTITVKGGTFKNLTRVDSLKNRIICGIYGAGAGGKNGIGSNTNPTPDERIPYWSEDGKTLLYGNYAVATANDNSRLAKYNCYNDSTHTYEDVDPSLTSTKIIIEDGVFGTANDSIDGIYAGGSGYMSPGLFESAESAVPDSNGGNIYGKEGQTVSSLTINGGEFYCKKGIFAGGRGTDYYYSTKSYGGKSEYYTALGKTYGNVMLTINGGTFHCSVFGGGYGVADAKLKGTETVSTLSNMARIYGKSTVNINGGTFYQNIYGGGDMAVVEYHGDGYATNVIISDSADIRGSVFAGGNGRLSGTITGKITDLTQHPDSVGRVIGSTSVKFKGSSEQTPYIYGDIYGGGSLAQVKGNTNVNIYAANFAGEIFGGGKGELYDDGSVRNSADVAGNTYITLDKDQGGQNEDEDGNKVDNFSINVVWDKMWDKTKFIGWDEAVRNTISDNTEKENFIADRNRFFAEGKYLNPHNIYGGGNLACKVGTYVDTNGNTTENAQEGTGKTSVTILKGMTPYSLLKTNEWKSSYNDNDNPHFYVFGGGKGKNTSVESTDVYVDVEGDYGIYDAEIDDDQDQLAKPFRSSKTEMPVFDNSKGIPNFTVLGVMGGGYSGIVTGNTKVSVDGQTFIHRVYGGGFGDPTSTENNETGQVKGNTEVYVAGAHIYGDVFGGGAGVAPSTHNGTHFTDVARVIGTTKVEVYDNANVYGKVYGGGDIANVGKYNEAKPTDYYSQLSPTSVSTLDQTTGAFESYTADGYRSLVNITGGNIYGEVYGGGKGLKKAEADEYYNIGRINGNTVVHIANSNPNAGNGEENIKPYVWNRIYGGCAYGTVDGNTLVHVEGGMLGLNIFGGGYGDVNIDPSLEDDNDGESTSMAVLNLVLGKKDTTNIATYANVLGNTKVQIDGGSWIWNQKADHSGNIKTWTASEADNEQILSGYEEFRQMSLAMNDSTSTDYAILQKAKNIMEKLANDKSTTEFFDAETYLFKKNHNIFGGGNRACYVGTYTQNNSTNLLADTPITGTGNAVVEINHSPLTDLTDSNGANISLLDCTRLQGFCWMLANSNKSHPQFSVFGAGYGANTKVGNAYVYAQPGAKFTDTGEEPQEINGKKFRYLNQQEDMKRFLAVENSFKEDYLKVSKEDKILYYGSLDGGNADGSDKDERTYQRYHSSRMAWHMGIPGFTFFEIHGGGFSGYVTGDTYVETDCQLNCRNIFGAGLGAMPYGSIDNTKKYDFGSIGGKSKVFVKAGYIAQNIYGGGAGIESVRLDGDNNVDTNTKTGRIFDFEDMARVPNSTEVHIYGRSMKIENTTIDRTMVFGSVYGGGDVANVGTTKAKAEKIEPEKYMDNTNRTTLVNIRGGLVFSQVFAGGSGRKKTECYKYENLGGVYGNTCLIVDRPAMTYPYYDATTGASCDPSADNYMRHPAEDVNPTIIPYVWGRMYGGCENGTVYGNTIIAVNDGYIGHNIFGGGWGSRDTLTVDGNSDEIITSADITGTTNTIINGGQIKLTSYWLPEKRFWEPASIVGDKTYSPQYNYKTQKFKINHNIYGGGNVACVVGEKDNDTDDNLATNSGNTYITMSKGLLYDNTEVVSGVNDNKTFFESNEWKEVYNKVGSPHFCVFGGGYGEKTTILGDTYVLAAMESHGSISNFDKIKPDEEYKHFLSGYSVMDIVGGGYSGSVAGTTHILGGGGIFCRRVFGGGFFNSVNATNVEIKAIDCHDVFGGGLMGDVLESTSVRIGYKTSDIGNDGLSNSDVFIHGDVYGGNDVSGYVNIKLDEQGYFADNGGNGTSIDIYGGKIYGNVYGAGNGDYLYALDKKGNKQVTVNENYPVNPNDPVSETEPLVYTVPMRENMPSYKAASDAAKIVNINSWRPLTNKVRINIEGNSESDATIIMGDVYGGGNSATVQKVQKNVKANTTEGFINMNIGNNVSIGRVFMGSNGDALFTASEDNNFMNKFQKLNGDIEDYSKELDLADTIDWTGDPSNMGISTLYLPTKMEERPLVYPHLLDLYFQPVETDIQGTLTWNGTETGESLTNCTIGAFYCGGNRGNMNVYPKTNDDYSETEENKKIGNVLEYTFPAGLTITDKIVGGCNNANYTYKDKVFHEGGYLLGSAHSEYPFIKLNIRNKFEPTQEDGAYKGGNVYGGCYQTGTIRGDITIDLESDMLKGKSKEMLEKSNELLGSKPEYSSLNVYGAGYGMASYVYGNTHINMANGIKCEAPSTQASSSDATTIFNASGTSANFVYGGGQQGNVIGMTNVDIYNGHVFKAATGGSYSGYVWGSTQVKVGYPKYYQVNDKSSGVYTLYRTDQNNISIDYDKNGNRLSNVASETIKQKIKLISGDIITQAVYDAINGKEENDGTTTADFDKKDYFTAHETPLASPLTWNDINIQIDEAVYGGGYSVAQGTSVLANNTTVLKYTDKYNLDYTFTANSDNEDELNRFPDGTTKGFGGNTTIIVGDHTADSEDGNRDHITISHQEMKPVVLPVGTDLFGYYYKHKDGTYRYIAFQDNYFYGTEYYPAEQDENDKNIYQYDSEGGIFGDGHQSYTEGFRSADLTGYGFAEHTVNSPKIINTFQRLDILRLEDNCFTALGARDYATNATNKTPYSIARVGEIQMIANNIAMEGGVLGKKIQPRSRNYLGLANNIHYVGAVYSNVAFNDEKEPWHAGDGTCPESGNFNGKSYQEVKQYYIDNFGQKDNTNPSEFQKRNDGTAKNMIGIASGYALKIQNVQEQYDITGKNVIDSIYYGPIYGVVEMNLIDVHSDEGGGYVYADNIHKRTNGENTDFLETTGNFVYPYTAEDGRFIVDDCFPTGYYNLTTSSPDTEEDVHYWYVTGFNYYYNAHITGYTYEHANTFYSDNSDGLTVLSGLKPKQDVTIVSWKMRSGHSDNKDDYSCDLEHRNYRPAGTAGNIDMDGHDIRGKYTLRIGASANIQYADPDTVSDENKKGFAALLPMNATGEFDGKYIHQALPADLLDDAKISFQLEDNANNTTSEYYKKHLAEKCLATIVLKAPAINGDGTRIFSKVGATEFYINVADKEYKKIDSGTSLSAEGTYYIYNSIAEEYTPIDNTKISVKDDNTSSGYRDVSITGVNIDGSTKYFCEVPRTYTYTVYLTIEYVQGPNISGSITVENCALPGEMIRVKKSDVVISADESFSANGYYWRIGKREQKADGKWEFVDKTDWSITNSATGYDTYKQGDKTPTTGLFAGCHYDKTTDDLDIPAYYFMNGYGVQLGVTMNGLDRIFPVEMNDSSQLVVHNYQRMYPQQTGINLHLAEAIQRTQEDKDFAEPRIYLSNNADLAAFVSFIDTIGTNSAAAKHGEHAQFVVLNDLVIPSTYKGGNVIFKGVVHGNGHVIKGLGADMALIGENQGHIYNIGLASGRIAANGCTNNGAYHCCFEYEPASDASIPSNVYRMNGTKVTSYTKDDFRFGRVAYDLNEYYLRARYSNTTKEDTTALKYVYDYYANGDYQYSRRKDEILNVVSGYTYLRTGKDSDIPNYGNAETRHDQSHPIDKARAQNYTAATADSKESRTGDYMILFDENKNGGEIMNDFIYWGQSLQVVTPDTFPSELKSQQNSYMTNRIYRTAGYYGDTKLDAFHYNAYNYGTSHMGTYVQNTKTTAIDFTCMNDEAKCTGMSANGIFYAPVADNASIFYDFNIKKGVTQNLLVYTDNNDSYLDTNAYDIVKRELEYGETKEESSIKGHHIIGDNGWFSTSLLHFVERTNSEQETCVNNDFCAPISFTVTNRAWYTRRPMCYANAVTGSWEGICLPFTVHKVAASINGEITHFYGTPDDTEANNPASNTHTLHHEYWLRGLTEVGKDGTAPSAIFRRPGSIGSTDANGNALFAPVDTENNSSLCRSVTYNFKNTFFTDTYEEFMYNKESNPYYASGHQYDDYQLQVANVPYIVRFPGERYYEFDLSSGFYNNITDSKAANQTITFNAYGYENSKETSLGDIIIPVTSEAAMATTANNGYMHQGCFMATETDNGHVYGINSDGTAFDDASTLSTVMPFRTYMTKVSSNAKAAAAHTINIAETAGIDNMESELNGNSDNTDSNEYMTVRPIGQRRVRIESTQTCRLYVYTVTGQLYRSLDVQPGTAIYSGFQSGIYLFGKTKVAVE